VPTPVRSLEDRIADKFEIDFDTGCWLWVAGVLKGGYGSIQGSLPERRKLLAHRAVYELVVEPIPEGLTLDHLCRVRHCVNPDHLEPTTMRENTLRGDTLPARNLEKTHCPQGHEYTPENTYWTRSGSRACRKCQREATRQWRARQAA
jgi:hypothetical protein